jgi:hypothetical protein
MARRETIRFHKAISPNLCPWPGTPYTNEPLQRSYEEHPCPSTAEVLLLPFVARLLSIIIHNASRSATAASPTNHAMYIWRACLLAQCL